MLKVFYLNMAGIVDEKNPEDTFRCFLPAEWRKATEEYSNKKRKYQKIFEYLIAAYALKSAGFERVPLITKNRYGKPYFSDIADLYFNISHSANYLVYALSDTEVGVDIQEMGRLRMNVANRFFHPLEQKVLAELKNDEQLEKFFGYWAVKESFIKYTGEGLSRSLSSFYIQWEQEEAGVYVEDRRLPLKVMECVIADGYKCFVCTEQQVLPEIIPLESSDFEFLSYS